MFSRCNMLRKFYDQAALCPSRRYSTFCPALRPPAGHLAPHLLRSQAHLDQQRWSPRQRTLLARANEPLLPEAIPSDIKLEVASDEQQKDVQYDEATKTVRIPLTAMDNGRRSKLVMFTCNKCAGRSARLVNPVAWEKGLVICQCQHCGVWHTIAANNPKIYEEIRYNDMPADSSPASSSSSTAGSSASEDTQMDLPPDADAEVSSRPSAQ